MPRQLFYHRRFWCSILLLGLIALAIWLPRAFALDKFVATDEVAWLWRSANFYYSLGQRDFAATNFNRSPGVVTMWLETAAFLLEFPEYRGFGQGWLNKYALFEAFALSKGVNPHDILVTGRVLAVMLNTTLLMIGFLYARKLFGDGPSLMGFFLIAFDPFHSGITRMAHLDGPMGSFSFLSLLAFLSYIYAGRRSRDLLISAGAGGLAILAKIPGFILIPTVGLIAFWDFWERRPASLAGSRARDWFGGLIKPIAIWGFVLLITIFVFLPAMWVDPVKTFTGLALSPLNEANNVVGDKISTVVGEQSEEQIEISGRSSGPSLDYLLRYPKRYLWRITPVILIGLLLAIVAYLRKVGILGDRTARKAVRGMLLFVILYTALMTIPPNSSEKYYLPVYPVLDLIAGIGWYSAAHWAKKFTPTRLQAAFPVLALTGVVAIQAALSLRAFPYYLTYFNPLLGGSRAANETLTLGSGEGLDLAADYLNQKPNAEQLKVMSWYGIGPFSYYFKGETVPLYGSRGWIPEDIARLKQLDYLVVYVNQWKRQLPGGLFPWLEGVKPEYRVWYDGIELVRIYSVESIPAEKFSTGP
jgi:4-amino-4-deoxy-L-arabinose transferase-like glycosyltransferase